MAKKLVCDFCSSPEPVARLFTTDSSVGFELRYREGPSEYGIHESVGDWAACIICLELIEARKKAQLLNRSWKALLKKDPVIRTLGPSKQKIVKRGMHAVQDGFWRNWTGMIEPIDNPRRRGRRRQ